MVALLPHHVVLHVDEDDGRASAEADAFGPRPRSMVSLSSRSRSVASPACQASGASDRALRKPHLSRKSAVSGAAVSEDRSEAPAWRLQVTLDRAAFEALEAALDEHADAVVAETVAAAHPAQETPSDVLRVTMFGSAPMAQDARPARLMALLRTAVRPTTRPSSGWVLPIGRRSPWPPFRSGSGVLTIVGAHQAPPAQRFVLYVEAGPAFGSGRHETTQGCLLALDRLAPPPAAFAVRWTSARAPAFSRRRRHGSGRHGCSPSIATLWRLPRQGRR